MLLQSNFPLCLQLTYIINMLIYIEATERGPKDDGDDMTGFQLCLQSYFFFHTPLVYRAGIA